MKTFAKPAIVIALIAAIGGIYLHDSGFDKNLLQSASASVASVKVAAGPGQIILKDRVNAQDHKVV